MNEIIKPEISYSPAGAAPAERQATALSAWNGERVRNTPEEVMRILMPMFGLFPQMKVEEATMALYIDMLRDISPERLERAVKRSMAECKFLPTVADIRERYDADRRPQTGSSDAFPDWLEAYPPARTFLRTTRAEQLERLKRTRDWDKLYA